MYDTATKAQFIDLRARGWSYDKIARHTGIQNHAPHLGTRIRR